MNVVKNGSGLQRFGLPGDHESDGERPGDRGSSRAEAGRPAELAGGVEDARPGVVRNTGPIVERQGHGPFETPAVRAASLVVCRTTPLTKSL